MEDKVTSNALECALFANHKRFEITETEESVCLPNPQLKHGEFLVALKEKD
jgi:hypothetical protein